MVQIVDVFFILIKLFCNIKYAYKTAHDAQLKSFSLPMDVNGDLKTLVAMDRRFYDSSFRFDPLLRKRLQISFFSVESNIDCVLMPRCLVVRAAVAAACIHIVHTRISLVLLYVSRL